MSFVHPALRAAVALCLTAGLAAGYANDGPGGGPHRTLNELALDRLISDLAPSDPILKWYRFEPVKLGFDLDVTGPTVLKGGAFYPEDVKRTWWWVRKNVTAITEGSREGRFRWWITEGGYTADEPEVFMAVRHFYDPTRTATFTSGGQTERVAFLTDLVSGWKGFVNPRMDARTWALTASPYALATEAKAFDLAALLWPADRAGQAPYLAKTWRCVGEAMHLLADMTVPAHVRNDGHPGAGWVESWLPDWASDPYEDSVTSDVVKANADRPAPADALAQVKAAMTAEALFDAVAGYTSAHCFSRDTISGIDAKTQKPVASANGQPAYPSPKLEQYAFEELKESKRFFYRDLAANTMIAERIEEHGQVRHEVDRSLKWQQGQLIPLAIEANARLMQLTLPRVRLVVQALDARRGILRCQAALCRREGDADRPVRLVLPTHRDQVLLFVQAGGQSSKAWAPLGEVRGNGFDVKLEELLKGPLAKVLSGEEPAPVGGVVLQVGLDMGGLLVVSEPFRPVLKARPKPVAPTVPTPPTPAPQPTRPVADGDPVTPREALAAMIFPDQPNPGDAKYGYVYNPTVPVPMDNAGHPPKGWAKQLDLGLVHWQTDTNANKRKDAEDQQGELPWGAWYLAEFGTDSSYALSHLHEAPGPGGVWPAPAATLAMRASNPWRRPLTVKLPLGDAAIGEDPAATGSGDDLPTDYSLFVARGPLVFRVTVSLNLSGRLGWGRFRRSTNGFKIGGDGDDPDIARWIDWPGGTGGIAARCNRWREDLPKVAQELAQSALAQWDRWYLTRVGPSVGLKGLYPQDVTPFWLQAEALPGLTARAGDKPPKPGDTYCHGWFDRVDPAWRGPQDTVHRRELGSAAYTVSVITYDSNGNLSANDVIAETKRRYETARAQLKRPVPVALPGADEAYEMVWRDGENRHRLHFRRANVYVEVWGSDNRGKAEAPVAAVRDTAKLLLRRLQGDTTPLAPAAPLTPAVAPEALQQLRWGQVTLRELALYEGKDRSPIRTEQLGPDSPEQVTSASWAGDTLTCTWQAKNLDTGYAVAGTLTAQVGSDGTTLKRLAITERRTEGEGTPDALTRTWQVTAEGELPATLGDDGLAAELPKLTASYTQERGGKVLGKRAGTGIGRLTLAPGG